MNRNRSGPGCWRWSPRAQPVPDGGTDQGPGDEQAEDGIRRPEPGVEGKPGGERGKGEAGGHGKRHAGNTIAQIDEGDKRPAGDEGEKRQHNRGPERRGSIDQDGQGRREGKEGRKER